LWHEGKEKARWSAEEFAVAMNERTFVIGGSREAMKRAVNLLTALLIRPEDDLELVLRKRVYKRSTEQNRRLWALLNEISEGLPVQGVRHPPEVWHEYFKGKLIGFDEMTLPNGRVIQRPLSTTTLDKAAFGEYMTRIEVWAAEHGILFAEAA